MGFNEYLTQALENDSELRKEYEALDTEYKTIEETIRMKNAEVKEGVE